MMVCNCFIQSNLNLSFAIWLTKWHPIPILTKINLKNVLFGGSLAEIHSLFSLFGDHLFYVYGYHLAENHYFHNSCCENNKAIRKPSRWLSMYKREHKTVVGAESSSHFLHLNHPAFQEIFSRTFRDAFRRRRFSTNSKN